MLAQGGAQRGGIGRRQCCWPRVAGRCLELVPWLLSAAAGWPPWWPAPPRLLSATAAVALATAASYAFSVAVIVAAR
eukprot:11196548-Lingulodinium_polyedra.AAC.1